MCLQKFHLQQSSPEIKIDLVLCQMCHTYALLGMHGSFILKEICFEMMDSI